MPSILNRRQVGSNLRLVKTALGTKWEALVGARQQRWWVMQRVRNFSGDICLPESQGNRRNSASVKRDARRTSSSKQSCELSHRKPSTLCESIHITGQNTSSTATGNLTSHKGRSAGIAKYPVSVRPRLRRSIQPYACIEAVTKTQARHGYSSSRHRLAKLLKHGVRERA